MLTEDGITNLSVKNPPISTAIRAEVYEFKEICVELKQGDRLLLTTDGLIEQEIEGEIYGLTRVLETCNSNKYSSPQKLIAQIITDFSDFLGQNSTQDDLTLLALQKK